MTIIAVYRDLLAAAATAGPDLLPAFSACCYSRHRPYFDGLVDTYGPLMFGADGLAGTVRRLGRPAAAQMQRVAQQVDLEGLVRWWMQQAQAHLPAAVGPCYLGTLFFMAPAATLCIGGRPAMAVAVERFEPGPVSRQAPRFLYNPDELAEMIPHEACHVARMSVLGLPASPRHLSLLDMVMLEGTALGFTDQLLGRETLRTFMPAAAIHRHAAAPAQFLSVLARDLAQTGLAAFQNYFSLNSPVSGYYAGLWLCRRYRERTGCSMPDLVTTPSAVIWHIATDGLRP